MSERIPVLNDLTDYGLWKKEVNIWVLGTQAKAEQQAARLIGFMSGKAHEAAIQIPPAELGTVAKLTTELDKLFLKDDTQSLFQAIEEFEQYNRSKEDSIDDYIRGFEQRYKRLKSLREDKDAYEDGIKAFKLLHQASLTSEQKRLIRATTETLTYDGMVKALKRTFGDGSGIISSSSNDQGKSKNPYFSEASSSGLKIKQEPVFYTKDSYHSSSSASDRSGYCSSGSDKRNQHSSTSDGEQEDEENVLYFQGGKYQKVRNTQRPEEKSYQRPNSTEPFQRQRPTGQSYQRQSPNYYQREGFMNKAENFKKATCLICGSPEHRVIGCPYNTFNAKKKEDSKRFTFLTKVIQLESEVALPERDERYTFFIGETVNKALLDTGASSTVCGKQWLRIYEESLSPEETMKIKSEHCETSFRFGDGNRVKSTQLISLPVKMFGRNITLKTYVVDSEIPLLLSRQTMNEFRFVIDMWKKKVFAMGGEEPILDTQSGHLVVSIGRSEDTVSSVKEETAFLVDINDSKKTANHLHRYFAHGSTTKIGEWIKTTKIPNVTEVIKELEICEKSCDWCMKYKSREKPHRKVAIPSGNTFNDVVAVDLKKLDNGIWIVHYIDTVTRFTVAAPLKTKTGKEIMTKTFNHWISIFGRMNTLMSDNGGEFVNYDFLEMCSMCSINFKTSPASSPWCNGMIERHHSLLSGMVNAILEEQNCNIEIAIAWACNAKNSLNNVFGFSPYQLVFGRTPSVSSVLEYENLPVLNGTTASKIVAENLYAMETARKKFIELENSAKLKRVLRERVYESNNAKYTAGDQVYYKKDKTFLGPGYVVGQLANSVLIKHGGALIRVNPCKIVLKKRADEMINGESSPTDEELEKEQRPHPETKAHDSHESEGEKRNSSKKKTQLYESVYNSDSEEDGVSTSTSAVNDEIDTSSTEVHQAETEPLPQEATPSVEDEENQQNLTNFEQLKRKKNVVILKKSDVIRYKDGDNAEWTNGLIDSRAGKATGTLKNSYNVQIDGEDEAQVIDFTDKEVERLLCIEEDNLTFNVGMSKESNTKIREAKELEIKKFGEFEVYKEVKDTGQSVVSSRWIITEKDSKVKARLVARGFEENYPRSDAPTINKTSLRLLFTIATSKRWQLESLDITAAFLQSEEISRDVYLKPPADIRKNGIIWKLRKPVYGLGDSARKWYLTLSEYLKERCIMSKLDKCVFKQMENGKLQGIVVTHVDDLLYAGTAKFQKEIIAGIRKKFKISRMNAGIFTYLGWNVHQELETIKIDQRNYGDTIQPIEISSTRIKEVDSILNEEEKKNYQGQLGKLLWLSGQSRPDLSFDTLELSTYANKPCIKHVKVLNKVVKKIPGGPQCLSYRAMDLEKENIQIIFYSDASVGNLFTESGNQADSGRGYLVFVSNGKTANLVDWSSRKIKRVVHSAFAAETLACNDGMGAAIYVRQILSEILYGDPKLRVIPIHGFIDSNQLLQSIQSTKQCEEKRLRLDVSEIQECVERGDIESITWVPTQKMLADCLTKKGANSEDLCRVIETGLFQNSQF